MMQLETRTIDQPGNLVVVAWWTGYTNHGLLHVELPASIHDRDVAAELVAIRHLMFDREVFNRSPSSSKGYSLKVSKGAIKKLVQGKSTKKHLAPYAAFLNQRLEGISIDVSRNTDWLDMAKAGTIEHVTVGDDVTTLHEKLTTPAIGQIYLTRHAVKRYAERHAGEGMTNPWRSLTARLMNPDLQRVEIPRPALLNKAMRHGRSDNVEAWGHPDSRFVYLVVEESGKRTLVTVFRKPKANRAYQ